MQSIIYLATDVFYKGGIERYSRAQIRALKELRPDAPVYIYSYNSPGENSFEDPYPVDFHGQKGRFFRKIRFSVNVLLKAIRIRPEIIWVNHIHLLPIAWIYSLFSGKVKIVLNVYGLEIWSGLSILERQALHRSDLIISDCEFTAKYVEEELGISRGKIQVIWDPVDIERFHPRDFDKAALRSKYDLPDPGESLVLMILGRISIGSRHKGYDRLLTLMGELRNEDIMLIVAGDGDDLDRLKSRRSSEGLMGKVFFTGSIQEVDLVDIYQLADLFILVSDRGLSRGEGIPLTPLEAAACEIPIIVGNQDGSQEAVREGINGYIVSPDEPEILEKRVLDLYNDPAKRKTMAANARKIIETEFSYPIFEKKHQLALTSLKDIRKP